MGFRFRKIFSFGKGLRLNISKRGMSTSLGVPGATLNFGKRGIRPTVGLPGTGMSFTPSMGNSQARRSGSGAAGSALTNVITSIIAFIFICAITICCVALIFINPTQTTSTPTAESQMSIQDIIESTSAAAQIQTQSALPTAAPITATLAPTMETLPTATIFIFEIQTNVANPTEYIFSTNTPFALATQPITSGESVCSCDGGLDCKDFSTHNQAQACFEYCKGLGLGDVHGIDGNDKDNLACESLP